jgi:serine/threonine protein kinase
VRAGDHIDGRYRVERKLGDGGMGEVWLATHLLLERQDALKVIHASLAGDDEFVQRFVREARAINRLDHPSIVRVFDFGRLRDGRFYLAMKYVEGEPLDVLLDRSGQLPLPQLVSILAQLADAIGHAHARGVIHRDLKPQNLLLSGEHLMVLDFGIAKILRDDPMRLSATGQVLGTPSYMAPEQLRGVGDDPRSDLYALGCIAYQLATGAPPFVGEAAELAEAHLALRPESPSRRRREGPMPRELDELIMRCLEKDPRARHSGAPELRAHLEAIRLGPLLPRPTPGAPDGELDIAETVPARASPAQTQPTAPRTPSREAGRSRPSLVRQLARTLRDAGHDEQQFVVLLGRVTEIEDTLASVRGERHVIDALAESVERGEHAREVSLRFALGELLFEHARLVERRATIGRALSRRIEELERRLREVAEHRRGLVDRITDHSVALVAQESDAEDELEQVSHELEPLVAQARRDFADDPAVDALWRKLAARQHQP